jgi:Domain of unknown function (DUF4390)
MFWYRFARMLTIALLCGTGLFFIAPSGVYAQSGAPRAAELKLDDDALALSADFDFSLPPALEDALARGVALYFVLDIEVTRTRLLIDETIFTKSEPFRLAYVPLTRSWRLSSGLYTQNLSTVEAATRQFSRLRGFKIVERRLLQKGEKYNITVKLRHDINQLPKPLQVGAIGSRDWALDVDPIRLTFSP